MRVHGWGAPGEWRRTDNATSVTISKCKIKRKVDTGNPEAADPRWVFLMRRPKRSRATTTRWGGELKVSRPDRPLWPRGELSIWVLGEGLYSLSRHEECVVERTINDATVLGLCVEHIIGVLQCFFQERSMTGGACWRSILGAGSG
jgi:hypothetical protein